jgi:hypothetical protein
VTVISTLDRTSWTAGPSFDAAETLERGAVLFLPALPFAIETGESALFSPSILGSAKNASFSPATGQVGGTTLEGESLQRLRGLMARFSDQAASLVRVLLPHYRDHVTRARASFRPAEIAGRHSSWRKDDTRLHVDSFPATPVQGKRILRVFSNVNPDGRPRSWRVGDEFEPVARRFVAALSAPWPGTAAVLQLLRVTKSRRSAYDALMLQLHDAMKHDDDFQAHSPQTAVDFPAGSTWMAFTDQVPHAAMAGQYQLEQTFLLPVSSMLDERRSPLRVLERMKGCALV